MGLSDILYPEQKKILDCWNQVKAIGYRNEEIALETILFSVLSGIQRHEKSIVIIPDETKRYQFSEMLKNAGISALCLEFDTYSSVTKDDVKLLQQKIAARHSDQLLIDSDITMRKTGIHAKKIGDILASFHGHEGDRTFQSVLDRLRCVQTFKNINLVTAVSFELFSGMDEEAFDSLYDVVVKASMLYNPRYYHGRSYRTYNINERYISSEDKLHEFLLKMAGFIEEIEKLRDAYYQFFLDTRRQNMELLTKIFRPILNELDEVTCILQSLNASSKEPENSSFFKFFGWQNPTSDKTSATFRSKYQELEKKLKELPDFTLPDDWAVDPLKDRAKSESLLISLQDRLHVWFSSEKDKINSYQKYSNIYNQKEKDRLASLESRFFNLIQSINEENLVDKKFEINTISLQKQTGLINSMLLECNFLYSDVSENNGYYIWDAFYQEQPKKVQDMLEWFKNFPAEEWANIFEYIYLQAWIEEKTPPHASELSDLLSLYKLEVQRLPDISGTYLSQREMTGRPDVIKNLSTQNKSLYKNIQSEKGLEKLNWRYFFENNGTFWGSFFHVILTSGDQFEDLEPGVFTNLFYLDHKEINPEVLHLGTTIHSYFPHSDSSESGLDLILESEKMIQPVSRNKPSVEMLQNARALAKTFVSIQDTFAIFQTKNANIISCLHPVLNSHVLSHFRNLGIKELHIDNNQVERLVECLIETSRRSVLLIQDYVINPLATENLAAQLKIIEDFEKMSYDIHNVESLKLAADFKDTLLQFFEDLPLGQ